MAKRKAVFLDRDGVLIKSDVVEGKPIAIQDIDRLELIPGVEEACGILRAQGYLLVMVTNQPDIGRGLVTRAVVDEMNNRLVAALGLSGVRVCHHSDSDKCTCRKPEPGMIVEAAREMNIDLGRSMMVGDRWRDIEAGRRAGCRTVYIDWGHGEPITVAPDYAAASLLRAVAWICS